MENVIGDWNDELIRVKCRQATRAGITGYINDLKESPVMGIEPDFLTVRNEIIRKVQENENRAEKAREDIETIILRATEEEKHKELEAELRKEFPELSIRITPTVQMFGFPGMVKTKSAELLIVDKRFEGELPEVLEMYKEGKIFEER